MSDCWLWSGKPNADGYGLKRCNGKQQYVHRLSYMYFIGPIPEGHTIDHLCRVRNCYNPAHLEAVTRGENVLRGEGLAAVAARRDCCKHGHVYDEENTYITKGGTRTCRTCRREGLRRWYAKHGTQHNARRRAAYPGKTMRKRPAKKA